MATANRRAMAHAGSEQSGAWPCSWQAGTVTNNTKNPADGVFGFRFLRRPLPMLAGTVPAHHPATAPGMPRKRSNATPWPPQRSASASHRPNPTNKKQEKKRTKKKKEKRTGAAFVIWAAEVELRADRVRLAVCNKVDRLRRLDEKRHLGIGFEAC